MSKGESPAAIFASEQPAGAAVYNFQGGCLYSGARDAETRRPHGLGAMLFGGESCVYVGEWAQGRRHGVGRMVWSNRDQYEGCWEDDTMCGQGEFMRADGSNYKGSWKDGRPQGEGQMVHTSGRQYEGNWVQGKIDGTGAFRFESGAVYDGPWKANLMADPAKESLLRGMTSESFTHTTRRSSVGKTRSSLLLINDFEHSYQIYPRNFKDWLVYTTTLFFVGLGIYLIMRA